MPAMYTDISRCRICGSDNLSDVLDFGEQFLSSSFVKDNAQEELATIRVPLSAVLCGVCGLVQLRQTVDRDLMYRSYFYRSETNPMMREALKDIVRDINSRVELNAGDAVLDIGCNDGTMLSYYDAGLRRFGMDPAKNIDRSGLEKSITVIEDYFNGDAAKKVSGTQFKAISSIAMFYDLDDPNTFVSDIKSILAPGGIWCVQLSYLGTTIETLNFYDVCHEHLLYYSFRTLAFLMERHGLKIVDVSENDVNGGSVRLFVTHADDVRAVTPAVEQLQARDESLKLSDTETYKKFADAIDHLKTIAVDFIQKEKAAGGTVIGLGASTKGNVLLQYFGITKEMLPVISERNPEKVGLHTLGTDIELISEDAARLMHPSAMLVLIWFFKEELLKRESAYLEAGGKLFFPMPYPHVMTKNGETRLN